MNGVVVGGGGRVAAGRERSGSFGICVPSVVLLLVEMSPFLLKYKLQEGQDLARFAHLMS